MKPKLVDYEKIYKKKIETIDIKPRNSNIQQVENYYFFFNLFGIIIIITGFIVLFYRKKNKMKNKRIYTQKVVQFYHDTNKNNKFE
jgi:uncharacterized membrane protein YkgB